MEYIRPQYYGEFTCVGGSCPDTCCAGWQIVIDEAAKRKYKNVKGPFGNRLQNEIDWKESVFRQYNGDCCFLNEDHLCDIYSEIGEENLCYTCRTYPRYTEEYDGLREQFLCISCPIVADLLLGKKEKTKLISFEREENENEEEYEDFDFFLFTQLQDSREYLLNMLQDSEIESAIRLSILTAFGHDMQRRVRRNEICYMQNLIEKYQNTNVTMFFEKQKSMLSKENWSIRKKVSESIISDLSHLEIRTSNWKQWITLCRKNLRKNSVEQYREKRKEYNELLGDDKKQVELYQEQIAVYFLLHYYCGAVYDDQISAKVKMAVMSTYLLEEMLFLKWIYTKKVPGKKDWVKMTYQYARELEHSDLNLERMENILVKNKTYRTADIIAGILCL